MIGTSFSLPSTQGASSSQPRLPSKKQKGGVNAKTVASIKKVISKKITNKKEALIQDPKKIVWTSRAATVLQKGLKGSILKNRGNIDWDPIINRLIKTLHVDAQKPEVIDRVRKIAEREWENLLKSTRTRRKYTGLEWTPKQIEVIKKAAISAQNKGTAIVWKPVIKALIEERKPEKAGELIFLARSFCNHTVRPSLGQQIVLTDAECARLEALAFASLNSCNQVVVKSVSYKFRTDDNRKLNSYQCREQLINLESLSKNNGKKSVNIPVEIGDSTKDEALLMESPQPMFFDPPETLNAAAGEFFMEVPECEPFDLPELPPLEVEV